MPRVAKIAKESQRSENIWPLSKYRIRMGLAKPYLRDQIDSASDECVLTQLIQLHMALHRVLQR